MTPSVRRAFGERFWAEGVYTFGLVSAGWFALATVGAMVLYPGGSVTDKASIGYVFTRNFFSDLGMVTAHNGVGNVASMALFFTALLLVGLGLVAFFVAYPRLFAVDARARGWVRVGSLFGALAGVGFIGVACTPADLMLGAHITFVKFAFRCFPLAALCCAVAIFRAEGYPRAYGWVFVAFGVGLVAYLLLLEFGPAVTTDAGLAIQVGGQKLVVYGSIASVMLQAVGARQEARRRRRRGQDGQEGPSGRWRAHPDHGPGVPRVPASA